MSFKNHEHGGLAGKFGDVAFGVAAIELLTGHPLAAMGALAVGAEMKAIDTAMHPHKTRVIDKGFNQS